MRRIQKYLSGLCAAALLLSLLLAGTAKADEITIYLMAENDQMLDLPPVCHARLDQRRHICALHRLRLDGDGGEPGSLPTGRSGQRLSTSLPSTA